MSPEHKKKNSSENEGTRQRILEAALKLFSEKGYQGATTREIAEEAGIAEVTLFRHFASKDLLLRETTNTFTFLPSLKQLLPHVSGLPYEEALMVIADRFLDTLIQRKDWIRIMHAEVQRSSEPMYQVFHSFLDDLYAAFSCFFLEMQQKGELRDDFDPDLAARAFQGIFFNFFNVEEVLLRKNYKPADRVQAIREFVGIFVQGTKKPNHVPANF